VTRCRRSPVTNQPTLGNKPEKRRSYLFSRKQKKAKTDTRPNVKMLSASKKISVIVNKPRILLKNLMGHTEADRGIG
jgi:hypothetical protein